MPSNTPSPDRFHKSSYSGAASECVEVAEGTRTLVRDTQNRDHALLDFPASAWSSFLKAVKEGQL
ncbi:DUF397 domain-containing protein [Marinactinospora thermotolerans]|uniref:DUF397 domain-containing protein n=1 Tax=Marinactinospora thermotolerans TaxID=531310 RepID=UPI000999113E|nr:DUF397 domain-containing protein [Marinactinospora thermotolerans]